MSIHRLSIALGQHFVFHVFSAATRLGAFASDFLLPASLTAGLAAHRGADVDIHVPQVVKEIVLVVRFASQEGVSESIIEQIVDVPVPQILEEIVELVRLMSAMADRRAIVDVPSPQIMKTIVEVVETVPQADF